MSVRPLRESQRDGKDVQTSGETILGRTVDEGARLLEFVVVVHKSRDDRTKDLRHHRLALGVLGHDNRRLDVESLGVVAHSAAEDLSAGRLGLGDVAQDLVVRELGAESRQQSRMREGGRT